MTILACHEHESRNPFYRGARPENVARDRPGSGAPAGACRRGRVGGRRRDGTVAWAEHRPCAPCAATTRHRAFVLRVTFAGRPSAASRPAPRPRARASTGRTGEGTAARGTPWGRGEGPARLGAAARPLVALRQVRDATAHHSTTRAGGRSGSLDLGDQCVAVVIHADDLALLATPVRAL